MISLLPTLRVLAILLSSFHISDALPQHKSAISGRQSDHVTKRDALAETYVAQAIAAIDQMQTWYDAATGLWSGAWWNSANVVTVLADFQNYFPGSIDSITAQVFPTTLAQAPTNPGYEGFLDGFYDDELWWALAWIKVYDVTNDETYLNTAMSIFSDAQKVWGTPPCGGLWWDKAQTYVNAIANELYITTAIKLANRAPNTPSPGYYMNEAQRSWDWFWASGMINSQNLVNDGLTSAPACQNNGIEEFTYNQGVILSALTEFAWATNNQTYNDLANTLALAGIAHFTDSNGILHEPCEPNACDGDEEQFKGVFGRNVQFMVNRMNSLSDGDRQTYVGFLQTNANAIWSEDQVSNQLGLVWSGPGGTATVQTQSSALDVIVGAACVS